MRNQTTARVLIQEATYENGRAYGGIFSAKYYSMRPGEQVWL